MKRYRHEYVNDEVSSIHDDCEKKELVAEEIVERLNKYDTENRLLRKEQHLKYGDIMDLRLLNHVCDDLRNANQSLIAERDVAKAELELEKERRGSYYKENKWLKERNEGLANRNWAVTKILIEYETTDLYDNADEAIKEINKAMCLRKIE